MKRPNRTTIEIPEPLRARLRAYAEKTGLQQAEILRAALVEYLDRKEAAGSEAPKGRPPV